MAFRETADHLKGGRGLHKGGGRAWSEKRRHADTADRTAGLSARGQGAAIRAAWLTWWHLAASRGRNAKCALRVSRTAHLGFRRGPMGGGWVRQWIQGPHVSADTDLSSFSCARGIEIRLYRRREDVAGAPEPVKQCEARDTAGKLGAGSMCPSGTRSDESRRGRDDDGRPDRLRGASPRQEGPVSVPLDAAGRACGTAAEDSEMSSRARHHGARVAGDPPLAAQRGRDSAWD